MKEYGHIQLFPYGRKFTISAVVPAVRSLPWPSFLDNGKTANAWKIRTIPAMFLLNEKGIVVGENLTLEEIQAKMKEN